MQCLIGLLFFYKKNLLAVLDEHKESQFAMSDKWIVSFSFIVNKFQKTENKMYGMQTFYGMIYAVLCKRKAISLSVYIFHFLWQD